jgi:hypothetical protein
MTKKHAEADAPGDEPAAEPVPIAEYPKMLYLGPHRTPVTVQTAEDEAIQRAAFDEAPEPDVKKKGTR